MNVACHPCLIDNTSDITATRREFAMPVILKRFRSYIGNRSLRSLILRREQRQALQPPSIEPTELTVLMNLPDPPEHPSSLLLQYSQRQVLQPPLIEPTISSFLREGSIVCTNLPDPPEHPSSLLLRHRRRQALQPPSNEPTSISYLLREEESTVLMVAPDPPEQAPLVSLLPDDTNNLQRLPPIQQQAAAYNEIASFNSPMNNNPNTIAAGHQYTELPDPPAQQSSLLSPPRHHDPIGEEPGHNLPATFAKKAPTSSSPSNIGLHCVSSTNTVSLPHCEKLIDPPDRPEHHSTQEKQFENQASLVICSVQSTGAHDMQELPLENYIPSLIEALPTAQDSAQRQLLQPNQDVQHYVMNTPHQQLLLENGMAYHHYPLLLEAPAPGQSTSSNSLLSCTPTIMQHQHHHQPEMKVPDQSLLHATALLTHQQEQLYPLSDGMSSDSSWLFHQSMQNPEAMQVDHSTEYQHMQNHAKLPLRGSHSQMEGTPFPPPSVQLHMEVQPLKSVQPESELQPMTNNKLQPSDDIPFLSYPLPMQYPDSMQEYHLQEYHPTTDTEHSIKLQHESSSTLYESRLYPKKGLTLSSSSLQQSIKITSLQQTINIFPPKSVQPESEFQATKCKLQQFNDDSLPSLPMEPWLLEREQDLESHLVLAPPHTHYHHQLQSSTQQAFAARQTTQMPQLPLLAETTLAQDDEISNASSSSLFSSICSATSYDSLFADILDVRIQSATEDLVDLTRDADAATSKLDATTALSVEIATASYATLVFDQITASVGVSSTNVYPHSPDASVRDSEKESASNSKMQPSEKRWKEVVALGADVGVDVEEFHPRGWALKRKACDINLDGDTDHHHGQSIRSSLREYDILMNRKGNKSNGTIMENRKFAKVVVDGMCGKMARG